MANPPTLWKIESQVGAQRIASMAMLLLGVALVLGLKRSAWGPGASDDLRAAWWLGVLLTTVGLGSAVLGGQQVLEVDSRAKVLRIQQLRLLWPSEKSFRFADIARFEVQPWGDTDGGSRAWDVLMHLRNGQCISLFGGFFANRHELAVMQAHCETLECLVWGKAVTR